MKIFIVLLLLPVFYACNNSSDDMALLQRRVDSLDNKVSDMYKPGFGEFMSMIQVHHDKLWYAGTNKNWKLADFEVDEIKEIFGDIKTYRSERKESQMISMIYPALDSVSAALDQKNLSMFKNSFSFLTKTCNNCHHVVNYEFNVVKIPDMPPIGNQDFSVKQ
ncbi:MAG: hypothetical protein P8X42_07940 [Calditrichaceae bacterium]|jgi:hypothetical protein